MRHGYSIRARAGLVLAVGMVLALTSGPEARQSPQMAGQTQINECILPPIQGAVDLTVCGLGFTALGEIEFSMKNRGTVGTNTGLPTVSGTPARTRPTVEAAEKIRMDVYLDDKLIQSLYQAALGGDQTKVITAKIPSNHTTPRCGETRGLKIVIDPQNQIPENSETNNSKARVADRPCPDMEVVSIEKNFNDLKTEFVAEIRIANRGNAPARFRYMALTSNSSSFGPLPSADFDKWMEIEAGGSKKFTIGNAFSYSSMYVRVFLDRFNEVAELNESNNFKEKTLN